MTDNTPNEAGDNTPLSDAQIAAFWQEFASQLPALALYPQAEFVERGNDILARYAPALAIELEQGGSIGEGSADGGDALLVVTAHGNIDQFENVQAMVRQAPYLKGYRVQGFRSRSRGSDFSMGMQGFDLACSDVLVAHYDAGGTVGLELSFEKIIPHDMLDHARHMSFIMLDHVLGEWDFAVRVGPVEFVDAFSDDVDGAEPLSVFPPIFDSFIRDGLGRDYHFPTEANDDWMMLEVRHREAPADVPPDLLTLRVSANALATRADLPHHLSWRITFDSQEELDAARDAHEALQARIEQHQSGILAFTRVENMHSRVAAFYVEDPVAAERLAEEIGERVARGQRRHVITRYDPAWQEYLDIYGAVRPRDPAPEDDEE